MKCTVFVGVWWEARNAFNNWAKGKQLNREVIIHEQVLHFDTTRGEQCIAIFVYHPEGKEWDATFIQQKQNDDLVPEAILGDP